MATRSRVEWAQLAAIHWALSNTLIDASSRHGKTETDRKEYRKDARAHKAIAERLGDIAAAEATQLIKDYENGLSAGSPAEEEEEEEEEGKPVEPLQEEEEEEEDLPPRRRPGR
jgi:hypothetical protein